VDLETDGVAVHHAAHPLKQKPSFPSATGRESHCGI
jgi:hypothetical protein